MGKQIVRVNFADYRTSDKWSTNDYYYYVDDSIKLGKDDRVYIKNQLGENLAKVADVYSEDTVFYNEPEVRTPQRFLKIDLSEILVIEAKYERIREIEKAMDKKVKSIEKLQRYKLLEELDPSVSPMLEELKKLKLETSNTILIDSPKEENN